MLTKRDFYVLCICADLRQAQESYQCRNIGDLPEFKHSQAEAECSLENLSDGPLKLIDIVPCIEKPLILHRVPSRTALCPFVQRSADTIAGYEAQACASNSLENMVETAVTCFKEVTRRKKW